MHYPQRTNTSVVSTTAIAAIGVTQMLVALENVFVNLDLESPGVEHVKVYRDTCSQIIPVSHITTALPLTD